MARDNFLDKRGLGYLWGKITNKIATSEANITAKIPKKTSQLENDSNFAKKTDIPAPSKSMPKSPTASGAVGTGTRYSREDHQHPKQPLNEAEIKWGGGSISGGVSPIDAAIIPMVGYNKTECANPEGIIIEYSNDAGATWIDYGLSDTIKSGLVSMCGNNPVYIGGGTLTQKTLDDKLRITVNATKCGTYTDLKKILIEISLNGAKDVTVYIEKAKGTAPTEFSEVGTYSITGWSGWNSIDIGRTYFGGSTESNVFVLRFTFSIGRLNTSGYTSALQIMHILFIGNTNWNTPSVMARSGHLYTYNTKQDATFPANVAATSFTGSGNGLTTSFESAAARQNIKSGENLTTIFGKITRIFTDLKGLAFKDKVDKTDLSDAVQASLDNSVLYTSQMLSDGQKKQARTNINAAPGGFGWGGSAGQFILDANEAILGGFYYFGLNAKNTPFRYGAMVVIPRSFTTAKSCVTQIASEELGGLNPQASIAVRKSTDNGDGSWGPWEWVNPPMELGVEYRTMERYLGKPVYTQIINCGSMPDIGSAKIVSIAAFNVDVVTFISGWCTYYGSMFNETILGMAMSANTVNIVIKNLNREVNSSAVMYALVKYTKTTD